MPHKDAIDAMVDTVLSQLQHPSWKVDDLWAEYMSRPEWPKLKPAETSLRGRVELERELREAKQEINRLEEEIKQLKQELEEARALSLF